MKFHSKLFHKSFWITVIDPLNTFKITRKHNKTALSNSIQNNLQQVSGTLFSHVQKRKVFITSTYLHKKKVGKYGGGSKCKKVSLCAWIQKKIGKKIPFIAIRSFSRRLHKFFSFLVTFLCVKKLLEKKKWRQEIYWNLYSHLIHSFLGCGQGWELFGRSDW